MTPAKLAEAKKLEYCSCRHLRAEHGRNGRCANYLLCLCQGWKVADLLPLKDILPAKSAEVVPPTKLAIVVARARAGVGAHDDVIVALAAERDAMAAENARLRDQGARLVALLSYEDGEFVHDAFRCGADDGQPCEDPSDGVCWDCKRRALLAEIKAGA